ncbi:MAG: ferritin-like domain-containing protein [Verrucomicrobia bacterium]|nr:MAG: ferritin-like domain-containing protein [Verrucomicrobiota bacterium]
MNHAKWITHFTRNRQNRPEPDWAAPISAPPTVLAPMLRSVEQFRLGDGGGPASLIAFNRENFRSRTSELRQIVDLWFAEEAEHARLLGCAVRRFGGRIITSHWSFTAFCLCRRALGVRFELQVLTLMELVSTAYYRMLRNHSPDGPLAAMCELILRDEAGHVAFQRDRLSSDGCPKLGVRGVLWRLQFLLFGYAAGTMLWVNHAPCLKAIGGTRAEFYSEVTRQLLRFIRSLRRVEKRAGVPALWARPARMQFQTAK